MVENKLQKGESKTARERRQVGRAQPQAALGASGTCKSLLWAHPNVRAQILIGGYK